MSDYAAPEEVLPHRPPMLMIDAVLDVGESHVVARRLFRADEEYFRGHFPDRPVVPGVLLIEAMAQSLAYWALSRNNVAEGIFLTGIERARFRKPVSPGDAIEIRVDVEGMRLGVLRAKAQVCVAGTRVADARLKGAAVGGE